MSNSGLFYQASGVPQSLLFNEEGGDFETRYYFDEDVSLAKWFGEHRNEKIAIYGSIKTNVFVYGGISRQETNLDMSNFFNRNNTEEAYIFVDYVSTSTGNMTIRSRQEDVRFAEINLQEYEKHFEENNKIYDGGNSELYKN